MCVCVVCVCLSVCLSYWSPHLSSTVDCMVRQSEVVADTEMVELCSADVPAGTPTGACVVFIVDESLSMKNEHQWLNGFSQLLEEELNKAGDTSINIVQWTTLLKGNNTITSPSFII